MNKRPSSVGLLQRLRERKLAQWAVAYLAGAWLALEVVGLLSVHLEWPALVFRLLLGLLAVGFLAILVVAWYQGEQGRQRVTGPELVMIAGIFVLAGGVVALAGRSSKEAEEATEGPVIPDLPETTVRLEARSIAVLPFVNMSPDPDQEFFSDGLTEEILNVLVQVPDLRVPARTSSFYFKGKNIPIDSIARALRVAHVLEGSVRKVGDQIRITAQLIEAESGYHLWSDTYDRDLDDVFAVQDDIAQRVVSALRVRFPEVVAEPPVGQRTASTDAYNYYLLGRYHWNRRGRANVETAIDYFEKAIALDTSYASAFAGLADSYSISGYYHYLPAGEAFTRAAQAARRALELNPDNPDALVAQAYVALHHGWNFDEAEAAFRRALELNPGGADAHRLYALLHAAMGRLDDAVAAGQKAVELDPISPITHRGLGLHHYFRGDYDQALARQAQALEIEPNFFPALFLTGQIRILQGQYDAALGVLRQAATLDLGSPIVAGLMAHALGRAGHRDEALRHVATLESRAHMDGSAYWLAVGLTGIGDDDRAIDWLNRALDERSHHLLYIRVEPLLKPLHRTRGFDQVLDRVGFR